MRGPGSNSGLTTLSAALAAKNSPARETAVEVGPVQSVVPAEDLERVRVIKIDVEWQEIEVLRSPHARLRTGRQAVRLRRLVPRRVAPESASWLRDLCLTQGLVVYRLASGYSLDRLFPDRLDEPRQLDDLPGEQTDLLLLR